MEGKLIKQEKEYYSLYTNKGIFISDVNGGSLANRLSLKNCEAIANGYDLDDLAEEESKKRHDWNKHRDTDIYNELVREDAELIKIGFQKAIEIFDGKKFSEDDIKKRVEVVKEQFRKDVDSYGKPKKIMSTLDTIHQSLEQNEWDVIVEMEPYHDGDFINDGKTHIIEAKLRPRLDVDGCLILKRK